MGSTTKVEFTTIADCQSSLHRLVTSIDWSVNGVIIIISIPKFIHTKAVYVEVEVIKKIIMNSIMNLQEKLIAFL